MTTYKTLVERAKKNLEVDRLKMGPTEIEYLVSFAMTAAQHEAHNQNRPVNPIVMEELGLTRQRSNALLNKMRRDGFIHKNGRRLTNLGKKVLDAKKVK